MLKVFKSLISIFYPWVDSSLQKIHIQNNIAEATDRLFIVRIPFEDNENLKVDNIVLNIGDINGINIKSIKENKKDITINNTIRIKKNNEQYPDTDTVFPENLEGYDIAFSISLDTLDKISKVMHNYYPNINESFVSLIFFVNKEHKESAQVFLTQSESNIDMCGMFMSTKLPDINKCKDFYNKIKNINKRR